MKVIKHFPKRGSVFGDIEPGTVITSLDFHLVYVVIEPIPGCRHNAVNLENGKPVCFNKGTQVETYTGAHLYLNPTGDEVEQLVNY